jgi:ABC-type dipeptide/oligopeptide/nickel transport system ATPase component
METSAKFKFNAPCTVMISGGTGSGKSTLIKSILKNVNEMFTESVSRIFYVYNEPLSFFSDFEKEVEFINNIDNLDVDDLSLDKRHKLLILDDQLEYFTNNKTGSEISRLFTVKSHHTNTSVMFLSQTLFFNSQHFRLMNKNA